MSDTMRRIPVILPTLGPEPVEARLEIHKDAAAEERAAAIALFQIVRKYVDEEMTDEWIARILARVPDRWYLGPVRYFAGRKIDDLLPGPALDTLEEAVLRAIDRRFGKAS